MNEHNVNINVGHGYVSVMCHDTSKRIMMRKAMTGVIIHNNMNNIAYIVGIDMIGKHNIV